jgi:hypothetical protein
MTPILIGVLVISVVVSFLLFQALDNFQMHIALRCVLALLPIVATLFGGIIGLFASAVITGAVYKAG